MTTIEKSVDVHAPVRTAYNQWTQFESFPRFMEGVERITQETPTRTHWRTSIGGVVREFDAEITEQHPDERIAWHSVDGPKHGGVVTFHRIDDRTTRVHLQMEYEPQSLTEKAGAALGVVSSRVEGDLNRFKEFLEKQGSETGEWRGDVPRPPQRDDGPGAAPRGGTSASSVPPAGSVPPGGGTHDNTTANNTPPAYSVPPGGSTDFASEHSRPTYANEPSTEGPDESVPRGRGGAGGMD